MASTKLPARLLDTSAVPALTVSGNLTVDTNTLHVDSSNNNVGIGTTSPIRPLHIHGATSGDIVFAMTNNSTGATTSDGFNLIIEGPTPDVLLRNRENSNMRLLTNNTERMRIANDGKVGIGTTSPDSILHVDGSMDGPLVTIHQTGGVSGNYRGLDVETSSTGTTVQRWFNAGTELARMRGGGGMQIGSTSTISSQSRLELQAGGSCYFYMRSTNAPTGENFRLEVDGNNTFYILNDNSQGVYLIDGYTSWTGLSDETLKENITDIGSVLDKVKNYRTSKYTWIDDDNEKEHIGFIAQDWETDFPQVVVKDQNDKLGINYSETNVILLKAIQEQQTIIEDLKSRIETLEG